MGHFIVMEGLDGAGTTTQCHELVQWLRAQGSVVCSTREPTDRSIGRVIRRSLRAEPEAPSVAALPWMFAADRADHLAGVVEPALARSEWVISDRYLHSSLAYQSLTLPLEEVWSLNCTFRVPDVTFFVRVPLDVCLDRVAARGEEREIYEAREQLARIEQRYEAVIHFLRERGHRIVEISGMGAVPDIAAAIRAEVEALG